MSHGGLNIPDTYLIRCVLFFLLPVMTWILLNGVRSLRVTYWCFGGLCFGFGVFLILQRNVLPDWATYPLPNVLFFTAYLARIQALRMELYAAWKLFWPCVSIVLFLLVFEGIRVGLGDQLLRFEFVIIYHLAMSAVIIYLAFEVGFKLKMFNTFFIGLVHVVLLIVMVYQFIFLINNGIQVESAVSGVLSLKLGMLGALSVVISHFGYIGISLDRLISSETQLKTTGWVALNQKQQIIAQLDRQRSLGAMSASLGHEINQPLTAIMSNAQLVKQGVNRGLLNSSEVIEVLDKIIFNTQRANAIVENIRGFIKPTSLEKNKVDLGELVLDSVKFINQKLMVLDVDFNFSKTEGDLLVLGDATQLSQVLVNLYRNALEALHETVLGKITVSISHSDEYLVITVQDNGPGIAEHLLANIGEPFFSTKNEGLGLGLSISKTIIEQHGGQLLISNAEAGGACFKIMLPPVKNAVDKLYSDYAMPA